MKKVVFIIFLVNVSLMSFIYSFSCFGQIVKEATPPSTIYSFKLINPPLDFSPNFDWNKILDEDDQAQKQGSPLRAGFSIPIGMDINNSGEWTKLPDGRMIWRISLFANGATALGVVFGEYELPEGSELYLYNEGKTMVNGALGSHNNNEAKVLSTKVLYGDIITIEYIEKPNHANKSIIEKMGIKEDHLHDVQGMALNHVLLLDPNGYVSASTLRIDELIYMYTDVYAVFDGSKPNTGGSDLCQIDINCEVGDSWQNQKRGVIHNLNRIGTSWYYCSSSLMNNTLQNFIPYVLSAFHCGEGASDADRNVWQFYFNYERPNCGYGTPPTTDMMTGCDLRAQASIAGGSDMLLVELKSSVPSSYNPFFNGWNRDDITSGSGASIHHPSGDVKKISTYSTNLVSSSPNIGGTVMATNSAWRVIWSSNVSGHGCTEGGSSGSPLFNADGLIVGTLSGGSSTCANPTNPDFYGKFAYHWESNGTANDLRLKPWLDPLGTNPATLQGWDPTWTSDAPVAEFSASATNVFSGTEISFSDLSTNGPTEWFWEFGENAYPETSTQRNPKVTWITPGTYNVSLTVTNGNGSDTETKTNFITVSTLPDIPTTNPVTIGTGTSTSLYPFGIDGRVSGAANHVQSVSLYTAAEIGGGGLISTLEWYANTARTDVRNIQIWMKHTAATTLSSGTFASYTSGATQVYSGTFTPTPAGWVPINLTSNFIYNSTDNLLVIVYVNSASTSNITSACRYSTATSKHHRWNARNNPPTGNGTVDSNRPNIRLTFSSDLAPIADFGVDVSSFIHQENFDESWLPQSWAVVNTHATNNWMQGNPSAKPYTNIDPNNVASAIVPWVTGDQDEWLISPNISTADFEGQVMKVKFHIGFSRSWLNPGATMSFKISDDDGASWTELWNAIGDNTLPDGSQWDWRLIVKDISSFAGGNVKFAWQYVGNDGDLMALDGISLFIELDEILEVNIFEGETISLYDQTINNPLVWKWSAPGGTPTSSVEQNPTIRYNVAGQYTVSLIAGNPAGEDTKTKIDYVNVIGRPPIANFSFSSNFWTSSFKPFLQRGDDVSFYDQSIQVPTAWNWSFPGGIPSSSSAQNPASIVYNINGSYSVSINSSNAHGSDEYTVEDNVLVGGTQEITKIREGESLTYYGTGVANNYWPGHNQWSITAYADKYENIHEGTITQVRVSSPIAIGTGKNVIFQIWDDNSGVPENILGSKTVDISTISTTAWNTIVFDEPVQVSGTFYVGFVISYDPSHNFTTHQFVVVCVPSRSDGFNTAYFQEDGIWYDWTSGIGLNSSMAILPEFTFSDSGPIVGDVNPDGFVNVLDVVWFVDHLNDNTPAEFNMAAADVNGNGIAGEIGDFTALIDLILNGAKDGPSDIKSDVATIYLSEEGLITFTSDGTITAIQFELTPSMAEMEIKLLVETDHKLVFNQQTGKGVIYSMNNTTIPHGEVELVSLHNVDIDNLIWGKVLASNINHQSVEVIASKYNTTSASNFYIDFGLTIFPNPSYGDFCVKILLPYDAQLEFQLIDLVGRLITQSTKEFKSQGECLIDFRAAQLINPGVYIIRVNTYDKLGKILVQKNEGKVLIVK
jgi:PKD repeat protein